MPDDDSEVAVSTPKVGIRPIVSGLVFTGIGVYEGLNGIGPTTWFGWLAAAIFGPGEIVLIRSRVRGPTRLITFDRQGLVTRWGGRVPWSGITCITVDRRWRQSFLAIRVDESYRQQDTVVHPRLRQRAQRRPELFPDVVVRERLLDCSLDEFLRRIMRLAPASDCLRLASETPATGAAPITTRSDDSLTGQGRT